MHVIFIPYGIKHAIDHLEKEMECQKHMLKMYKDKEERSIWVQGSCRKLPFGVYEYVFPKEDLDTVLTTLNFHKPSYKEKNYVGKVKLAALRKALYAKKIPKKFDTSKQLPWIKDFVSIIPIGIREDDDIVVPSGDNVGWRHEGL